MGDDDPFVVVPKPEPRSPPSVRVAAEDSVASSPRRRPSSSASASLSPSIRISFARRRSRSRRRLTSPSPSVRPRPPLSQSKVVVVSKFFAKSSPTPSPSTGPRGPHARSLTRRQKISKATNLPDAAKEAESALLEFVDAAKKKSDYKEHEETAESVLIPFRAFVRARASAAEAEASGDVLCLDVAPVGGGEDDDDENDENENTTRATRALLARAKDSDRPGAREAGRVLAATIAELDRLHVNASCRVRQRAPEVARARARLVALRREARDAFKALDPRGLASIRASAARAKTSLPAARDAELFARYPPAGSMDELRSRCATMAATGSPHHLCLHLCYYREYDAARQLFVLRTRLAAAVGSASALDGWRAELRCATREEWGGGTPKKKTRPRRRRTKKPTKRRKKNGRDDDDDDDDDDDGDDVVVGDGDDEENETEDEAPEDDREEDPRGAKSPGRTTGGWLSAKSLPWRVVYVSPSGETFDSASDALTFLGVDANKAPPAAHNAAGGGGLGNETLDDFEWRDDDGGGGGGGAARRDARIGGARARGQVAPPPRVVDNNVSWPRASHGGSGVRLARPETRGLDDATDLLRAALWPEARDEDVGTEPVRARLRAAREGAPRSPVRLAPDPFSTGGDDGTSIDAPRSLAVAVVGPTDARDGAHDPTSGDDSPSAAGAGKRWWAPPRSPFGLLEEILFEDEWKLLTACMLLNCTTRLQVDRALWRLFLLAPTPEEAVRLGRDGGGGGGGGGDDQYDAGGDGAAVAVDAQLCARRPKRRTGLDAIEDVLAPLGLHRKRARAFVRLSEDYLAATRPRGEALEANGGGGGGDGGLFSTRTKLAAPAASLHGVGAYASDAHAMFCDGLMGVAPRDHALRWWYAWAVERRESGRRRRSDAGDGEASS